MANSIKLGCSTILFGGHLLDSALDGIKKAGYAAVELCCIPGMAEHVSTILTPEALKIIKSKIADRGLAIESIGASGVCGNVDSLKRVLSIAATLGAPAITTATGGKSDDEPSFAEVIKTWRDYAKAASEAKVKISVKPHVRAAVYHAPSSLRFIKELDTQWVGINYDPTHIYRTPSNEDPVASFTALAPYILTARFRDCAGRELNIGTVDKQVCGNGVLDIPAYFAVLNQAPSLQYVTLEIVGSSGMELAKVQDVIDRCAKFVNEKKLLK